MKRSPLVELMEARGELARAARDYRRAVARACDCIEAGTDYLVALELTARLEEQGQRLVERLEEQTA